MYQVQNILNISDLFLCQTHNLYTVRYYDSSQLCKILKNAKPVNKAKVMYTNVINE